MTVSSNIFSWLPIIVLNQFNFLLSLLKNVEGEEEVVLILRIGLLRIARI